MHQLTVLLGKFCSDVYTDVASTPQAFKDSQEVIKYLNSHDDCDKDSLEGIGVGKSTRVC